MNRHQVVQILIALLVLIVISVMINYSSFSNRKQSSLQPDPSKSIHPLLEVHPEHWNSFMSWWKEQYINAAHSDLFDLNQTTISTTPSPIIQHLRQQSINVIGSSSNHSLPVNHHLPKQPSKTNLTSESPPLSLSFHEMQQMISCNNQTQCIQPYLQLKNTYNVYYCKHVGHGVRFYYLAREGLLLHPKIRLVENIADADVIIYLPESAPWHKTECNNPLYWNKTIVLDEGDHPPIFEPDEFNQMNPKGSFLLTFKRSYVRRQDGQFKGYMGYLDRLDVLPMSYTIADAYVKPTFPSHNDRTTELLCTLRGSNWDPTRLRIRQWVEEYAKARGVANYVSHEINTASRTVISKDYFGQMYNSQIIVTSNPSHWEGDFRFCEAMASGALILVDEMFVPRPYPFKDNFHVVYYNNHNKTDLFEKLDYYRSQAKSRKAVAIRGYLHAMRYHRASNLIDYVFRTFEIYKLAKLEHSVDMLGSSKAYIHRNDWPYSDHGFAMRYQALELRKKMSGSHRRT